MVARLTSIVFRYQKVAVSTTVTLNFFSISRLGSDIVLKALGRLSNLSSPPIKSSLAPFLSPSVPLICVHRGSRMATTDQLAAFINRQRDLLNRERNAEIEQSALLLTNCGPKLLEQKGLAILGLGVVNINIGLGGKRYGLPFVSRPT